MRTAPDSPKTEFYKLNSPNHEVILPAIPPPSQSTLPPDGDITLEMNIGDVLGQNDRNIVYAVRVANADKIPCYVPPLVMKVARLFKGRNVSQEAGMYKDLECLQGSIIPRCYGYFSAIVDHTQMSILPWDGPNCVYPRTFDPFVPPHPSAPLSILLLERLGDPIPTGNRVKSETIQRDLFDIHDELARFGVTHNDWRLGNFLSAPPSPPGLPGLPSPNHDHLYSVRLFDFELAIRTNASPSLLHSEMEAAVENMVEDIAYRPASRPTHLPTVRWSGECSP